MNRSRVEGFVYPVAKTHQFLFTGQLIFCKLYRIGVFTLFFQSKKGIHNRSVCTSVERPLRAPIAPVMAEYISDSVAQMVRQVKVEAFIPCSACSTRQRSMVLSAALPGRSPFSI